MTISCGTWFLCVPLYLILTLNFTHTADKYQRFGRALCVNLEAAACFDVWNNVGSSEVQDVSFKRNVILKLRTKKTGTVIFRIIYLAYLSLIAAYLIIHFWSAGIAQSVQRLVTGWKVRGLNPDWDETFCIRSDPPRVPPSLLYNGCLDFLGGRAAGAWRWPPTPICAFIAVIRWTLPWLELYLCMAYIELHFIMSQYGWQSETRDNS
jgi:hypothetical protein